MKVIGLCGGSGSGKTAVSDIFRSFGIPVIDTDAIYHSLTSGESECLRDLRLEFGDGVIKNGALCRKTLAKMVFESENSDKKRKKLNEITHKYVLSEVRCELDKYKDSGEAICVVDIPLLFESHFDKECDITVAVIADKDVRLDRIITRDGIDTEAALSRINAQISNDELIRLTDMYIENSSDLDTLKAAVHELLCKIR